MSQPPITLWFSSQCQSVNSFHRTRQDAVDATDWESTIDEIGQTDNVFSVTLPSDRVWVDVQSKKVEFYGMQKEVFSAPSWLLERLKPTLVTTN